MVRFTATEPLPRYKDAAPPGAMPAPDAAAMPAPDYGAAPRKGEPAMAPISVAVAAPGASAAAAIDPLDIPWALELANGARCTLLTGATAVLAGERVNYGCEDGGLILGEVDRSAPLWAVSYLADGAFATEFVPVAVAWT